MECLKVDGSFEEYDGICPNCENDLFNYVQNGPHIECKCSICNTHIKYMRKYNSSNWNKAVKERDKYTCQRCGAILVGRQAHAHHKIPAWFMPELKYDLDNGICLCNSCHKQIHGQGGTINKGDK